MKFSKIYVDDIKEKQPGWRDKFLSYKKLKRLVRQIGDDGNSEAEFMCLLNNEIDKFNEFFIEKEEEFIIRHKQLEQNMKTAINLWRTNESNPSETNDYKEMEHKLIKDIVDLHGEMVLLINFCNINYTGLAKILKKYDRRTGKLQRLPFLQKMFEHFLSTNLISTLAKECENMIDEVSQAGEEDERSNEEVVLDDDKGLFKSKVEALFTTPENVMVFEESNASEPNECLDIKHTRLHDKVQFGIKALRLVLEMVSFRSCWCVESDLEVPYLYEKCVVHFTCIVAFN